MDDNTKLGVVVNCMQLNVRAEPSMDSDIICTIPEGTEVMVEQSQCYSIDDYAMPGFCRVYLVCGVTGFCRKEYITIKEGWDG